MAPADVEESVRKEQFTTENKSPQKANPRHAIGNSLHTLTEIVNNNIVAARYGTFASIALLTAYGISKTPIFFRYRRVSDIPSSIITKRKSIHGRIVHILKTDAASSNEEGSIVCLVRHLSPMGRLLNRSGFEFMARMSPHSQVHKQDKLEDYKDLLKVEIAAVRAPASYYSGPGREGANQWLENLATSRTPVSCTPLSRRILKPQISGEGTSRPHFRQEINNQNASKPYLVTADPQSDETLICKMKFRPGRALFRKDLATSLVTYGRASVASGMHAETSGTITKDGSKKLGDIEADVKYLEQLAEVEFDAVKNGKGMWSVEQIRNSRPDLVEEADFKNNASFWRKLWRRIRS